MGMLDGLSPSFSTPLGKMMEAARSRGITLRPLSGYRSEDDQRRAIQQVAQRNGIPFHEGLYQTGIRGMAAPVGRSQHQHGNALDWDVTDPATKRWLYENAPQYGFRFPLPNSDSGHMELGGPRDASPAHVHQGPAPMASYAQPDEPDLGILGRFIKGLNQTVASPLFQMGAGMVNAGAKGTNVGGGLLEGGQAAAAAAQQQALFAKAERERMAQAQRDRLWAQLSSGNAPAMNGISKDHMALASMLPPDEGVKFLTGVATKNAEGSIERDKLAETKRYHDLMDVQNRQREEDMRAMRASQSDSAAAVAELRREQTARMKREAEQEAALFGRPAPASPTPQSGPAYAPNVRPQSFEGEADPNLIRVQEPAPAAAPAPQARAPQQPTIKVPQSARFPQGMATPDEATAFAQELLTTEKFKPLGQQILKQVEAAREDRGLERGARGEIDKGLVGNVGHLERLMDIERGLDPRYLDVKFRLKMEALAQAEKVGSKLSPEQSEELQRYASFRARTIKNVNTLLKELSGSAVTEQEFARLLLQEPSAGTGGMLDFLKGDSYGQFLGKLQESKRAVTMAVARANWLRNVGINGQKLTTKEIAERARTGSLEDDVSLGGMERIMSRDRERVEGKIRASSPPGTPEEAIRGQVRQYMKGVYGI